MDAVGIIMECNPFHMGHDYFLREIKKQNENSLLAAIMSGDFVQRGEPAILPKKQRTQILLSQGADLVIELPVRFSLGNAGTFAKGAISLLNSLPLVKKIVFGSESGNIEDLKNSAAYSLKMENNNEFNRCLKKNLKMGQPYASAYKNAIKTAQKAGIDSNDTNQLYNNTGTADNDTNQLYNNTGTADNDTAQFYNNTDTASLLDTPNNLLGIEYIKALSFFSSDIAPETIKRDCRGSSMCAAKVREIMKEADAMIKPEMQNAFMKNILDNPAISGKKAGLPYKKKLMPDKAYEIIHTPKLYPITLDDFSLLLYDKLLSFSEKELSLYEDVTPQLAASIKNNLSRYQSFTQFADRLHTKNYTLSRVKRSLFHILLSIKKVPESPEKYQNIPLRVLGMKKEAAILLKNAKAPVITTGATINSYNREHPAFLLSESIHASLVYRQAAIGKFHTNFPDEYHSYPIIP